MIDKDVILNKANKVDHHLRRIRDKRVVSLEGFLADLDCQESILFNLQMAVQNCIDIAAHIIRGRQQKMKANQKKFLWQEFGWEIGLMMG